MSKGGGGGGVRQFHALYVCTVGVSISHDHVIDVNVIKSAVLQTLDPPKLMPKAEGLRRLCTSFLYCTNRALQVL